MILSNKQKKMLHWIPRRLDLNEDERRTIQRSIGGFGSAADTTITREGFQKVMAFYEHKFGGQIPGQAKNYWNNAADDAKPTDAIIWTIRQVAGKMDMDDAAIERFLASEHMSGGRCDTLSTADMYWLRRLLEALKQMSKRQPLMNTDEH